MASIASVGVPVLLLGLVVPVVSGTPVSATWAGCPAYECIWVHWSTVGVTGDGPGCSNYNAVPNGDICYDYVDLSSKAGAPVHWTASNECDHSLSCGPSDVKIFNHQGTVRPGEHELIKFIVYYCLPDVTVLKIEGQYNSHFIAYTCG
jgi:hypothetical protein